MKTIKNLKYVYLTFLFMALCSVSAVSQDQRTLDTKIADLLMQIPADNEAQLNVQMKAMLSLEEAGLQQVLGMIIPPGTEDDTKPRMAVESFSRFLSQPGMEKEKAQWESQLLLEIEKRENPLVKGFLMSQLNYIGGVATVTGLEKYLADETLFDPAIRAMRDADPGAAANLFVKYLQQTTGQAQIALLNALGKTGNRSHAASVGALAGSTNPDLQKGVLAALAKLGNPDSYSVLNNAAKAVGHMPDPTHATSSLLAYAETVSELGNPSLSKKICKQLMKKCSSKEQIHFKIRALLIAAGNEKIESSVTLLVDALENDEKPYRMAALDYAAKSNTPVEPWIIALKESKKSEVKAEIIFLFGLLRSEATVEVVTSFLTDSDAQVRQQAAKSLALIQKEKAVPELIRYAMTYPEVPDTETAKSALLQTVGKQQVHWLVEQLNPAREGAKAVFIEVIAEKGDPAHFPVLFSQLDQGGLVRSAVLASLYRVSSEEHMDDLLPLFVQLDNRQEQMHLEKALVASVKSSADHSAGTSRLLSFAKEHSTLHKFIGVLAGVGGKEALDAVYDVYNSGSENSRKEAFKALVSSNDIEAADALFEICKVAPEVSDKEKSFRSYVRAVLGSTLPDDQKLLLLRKIEPLSPHQETSRMLINALGYIKTFLSFVTLSSYLDDEVLRMDAANALVRVVLPSQGLDNGLKGKIVKENLIRAREIVTGPDSEYLKIDIEDYLNKMSDQPGFVSMFNGKDLTGWQGLAADPVKKAKLSEKELMRLQEEADAKLKENWSVKDQCIVFNGHGSNLCSIKEYGSFEMIVDWRITKKGDSGIYLRGSPQIQIWDTSRVEVGAQVGSGGLYNNQEHERIPLVVADNPVGEWNTFRITMLDERVTVYLNGQLVVDDVVMENYWDRSIPIFPSGSIELQAHGTDLAFRDIYVKEIELAGCPLSEEEKTEGFRSLFNGKDLTGWTGKNHSYKVEEGTIVVRPDDSGGNIYTEKEYDDFVFRFEFKLSPGANNGLGIRTPMQGDAAYSGFELQILDNTAPVYANLKPYQYHGSVYGIIPAKRGFLKPVGEWNSEEVWIKGDDIRITLNGTTIVEGNLKEATRNGTADGKEHPGLERTGGYIGFLGHGSLVWFRNIRIKEL